MFIALLTLIFIRPFISSLAFPYLNFIYSAFSLMFLIIWLIYKGISIEKACGLKYPLILFSLALIISVIFSINKLNSFKELYKYINGILLLLIAASLSHEDKMRLIRAIISAGLIISVLAIYQYFFGFGHTLKYISQEEIINPFALDYIQRQRVFFPFVTPNILAGYLIMVMPLSLINKSESWFIIPFSFALLLTKSLGALLSIFLTLIIYFYLQGKLEKKKIIFLIGLLIIIGLVFITRLTTQKQHLQPIFSTIMRFNYWTDALKIIKDRILAGVGLGNFNLALSRYAHNSYLQIWAEMGILGISAWIWIIFNSFKIGLKNLRVPGSQKYIIAGLISANFCFLIHNLIDFTFFLPEVSLIWWVVLGLTVDYDSKAGLNHL